MEIIIHDRFWIYFKYCHEIWTQSFCVFVHIYIWTKGLVFRFRIKLLNYNNYMKFLFLSMILYLVCGLNKCESTQSYVYLNFHKHWKNNAHVMCFVRSLKENLSSSRFWAHMLCGCSECNQKHMSYWFSPFQFLQFFPSMESVIFICTQTTQMTANKTEKKNHMEK